jgi:SAM-dependent methyltransferase
VGVDLTDGPGVDRVGYGHELDEPDDSFDVAISGECFEHDPHWSDTFRTMVRVTRPGGVVAFTCASTGRPEHGTTRTDPSLSPGTQSQGWDYYQNRTEGDFAALPLQDWFAAWRFWYVRTSLDLFFAGVRHDGGGSAGNIPRDEEVRSIESMMAWPHRVVRWPLKMLTRSGEPDWYQSAIRPYWKTVLWLGGSISRVSAVRRPD